MEEKRQKLEDFHPQIEKETVFRLIHCYPDSSVYEDMEDSFQEMQEEMLRLCHPVGVMAKGRIPAALDPRKEGKEREVILFLSLWDRKSVITVPGLFRRETAWKECWRTLWRTPRCFLWKRIYKKRCGKPAPPGIWES